MQLGMIGLGRMGANISRRLIYRFLDRKLDEDTPGASDGG